MPEAGDSQAVQYITMFTCITQTAIHGVLQAVCPLRVAAVFLPVLLGYLWVTSPASVFGLAAGMALVSFVLALLVPRDPEKGNETRLTQRLRPVLA